MLTTSVLLTFSMVGFVVAGLVRHKAAAIWFGADGVGVLAQAAHFQMLLVVLSGAGVATGARVLLTRSSDQSEVENQFAFIFWFPVIGSGLLAGASWIVAEPIAYLVMGDSSREAFVVPALAGLPFAVGAQIAVAAAQALGDSWRLFLSSMASALVASSIVLLLMAQGSLIVGAWSLMAAPFTQLVFVVGLSPSLRSRLLVRPLLPAAERRVLLAVAGASFILGTAAILGDNVARAAVVAVSGVRVIGEFQPVAVISGQLFSLVLGALAATTMVEVGRNRDRRDMGRTLSIATRDVALIVTAAAATISAFRDPLVELLFDTGFQSSAPLVAFALAAEPLKAVAWLLGSVLLPLGYRKRWLAIGLGSVMVQTTLVLLTLRTGAWALVYGMFGGAAFAAVATLLSLRATRVVIARSTLLAGCGGALYVLLAGLPGLLLQDQGFWIAVAMAVVALLACILVSTSPQGFLYPLRSWLAASLSRSASD